MDAGITTPPGGKIFHRRAFSISGLKFAPSDRNVDVAPNNSQEVEVDNFHAAPVKFQGVGTFPVRAYGVLD